MYSRWMWKCPADGLTFLEKLMRARPMPVVVMVSSLTERGCDTTL